MPASLWLGSPNYAPAHRQIGDVRGLVLHDCEGGLIGSLTTLRAAGGASAHYVVDVDGSLYQLVADVDVAFHVAAFGSTPSLNRNRPTWLSAYNGRYSAVNAATIGIELVGFASQGFTPEQYATLGALCADLCQRWHLAAALEPEAGRNATILTHGFLQTDRTDPGPHFDWQAFSRAFDAATAPATPKEPAMSDDQQQMLTLLAARQITSAADVQALITYGDQTAKDVEALRSEVASTRADLDEAQHQAAAVRELVDTLTAQLQAAQAAPPRRVERITLRYVAHYSDGTEEDVAAGNG